MAIVTKLFVSVVLLVTFQVSVYAEWRIDVEGLDLRSPEEIRMDTIYHNCIVDKLEPNSSALLENSVHEVCLRISADPNFWENMKYE